MAADPLDRIADICREQPHDALTQIASVLGFTERPPTERWSVAPGDARMVIVPGVVKPINAGNAERARLIVAAVNAYGVAASPADPFPHEPPMKDSP